MLRTFHEWRSPPWVGPIRTNPRPGGGIPCGPGFSSYNLSAPGSRVPRKMRTPDGARPEVITAKWKTALDSNEEHFGTITLDDAFELTLPILHSFADIPSGTTLLWGVTDNNQIEHLFNASRAIRHL